MTPPIHPPRGPAKRGIAAVAAAILFPRHCPVTGQHVADAGPFSAEGWSKLQFLHDPSCRACGLPFAEAGDAAELCAACAAPDTYDRQLCGPAKLDAVRSALAYNASSAELVLSLKYGDRHDLGVILGRLLASAVRRLDPPPGAVLVPVPLHVKRLRTRRFNQAALLARAASQQLGLPVRQDLLGRRKSTPQQKGLSVAGRFRNQQGAFDAARADGIDAILVDDVLTSGATLIGCAKALKRAGARSVTAVTIARALPNTPEPDIALPEL